MFKILLVLCFVLVSAKAEDLTSLKTASDYFNGRCVPDSNLFHYIEFTSFVKILKIVQDSTTKTIEVDTNNLVFSFESKLHSQKSLVRHFMSSNFKDIYVNVCTEMLKAQVEFEVLNKFSIDEVANYYGVFKEEKYRTLRKSLFDF
jgi:hypothetical protein